MYIDQFFWQWMLWLTCTTDPRTCFINYNHFLFLKKINTLPSLARPFVITLNMLFLKFKYLEFLWKILLMHLFIFNLLFISSLFIFIINKLFTNYYIFKQNLIEYWPHIFVLLYYKAATFCSICRNLNLLLTFAKKSSSSNLHNNKVYLNK